LHWLVDGSRIASSNLCIAVCPDVCLGGWLVDLEKLLQLRVLLCFFSLALELVLLPGRWEIVVAPWRVLLDFDLAS
jgi:hypothetical protein